MVSGQWAQSTKHIRYEPISCYHWPTGCSKHQLYVHAVPLCIIDILLPAVMLLYYCWFSETTTRGTACSEGLPLMAVCDLFMWGVEHGDAFYKGFQWHGKALFGRKTRRLRLKNRSIFNSDLDWKDRPLKPSIQCPDFPKDCNLFKGIPISIIGIKSFGEFRSSGARKVVIFWYSDWPKIVVLLHSDGM